MFFSYDPTFLPNVRFIGYISYKELWMHFKRKSNEYILYFVKNGCLNLREEGTEYTLKRGNYILLEPGKEHEGYEASCCDYYYVHFRDISILPLAGTSDDTMVSHIMEDRAHTISSNCLIYDDTYHQKAYIPKWGHLDNISTYNYILNSAIKDYSVRIEHYRELVSCRILELLLRISRDYVSTQYPNQVSTQRKYIKAQSIMEYLTQEYVRKIPREEIEEEFEASYDYLNRSFKELTGHSIHQYLNIIRINKAKELIETTQMKFSEIGYLVGIDDPYYFSKIFKKHTGTTPTQYYKTVTSLKSTGDLT